MKIISILLFCVVSACTNASETSTSQAGKECPISLAKLGPCTHGDIKVSIVAKNLESDEKLLQQLNVEYKGKTFTLAITKDTSILEGDNGFVLFDDINFDGNTDIAITTSFGVANLYMDYWVYNPADNKFDYVGNYVKFALDSKTKTVSTVVKDGAAKYDKASYSWNGTKLVKQ